MTSNHMDVIDRLCGDIQYGYGRRVMAIEQAIMQSAPESLLTITTWMSGRDIAASDRPEFKELCRNATHQRFEVDADVMFGVFFYKESQEPLSFFKAKEFANHNNNMRLPTKAEAEWFTRSISYGFTYDKWYWTGHPVPISRFMTRATAFNVSKGFCGDSDANLLLNTRCFTLGEKP